MKKLLTATILTSLFSYSAMAEPMGDMSQAKDQLRILHFNDFHARFEPVNKYNSVCSAEDAAEAGKCFGGAARLAGAINDGKADAASKGQDALVLVGGDAFQGTLFYSFYKGKATADVMNQMEIDAWALGNHEFDDGPSILAEFADNVNFPLLMANAEIADDSEINGKILPYIVKEVGDQKVGIIGLITEQTSVTSSPGDKIKFLESIQVLPPIIEKLKAEGVNKIIVLTHIGFWNDVQVAKNVAGIDLIVGGHTNTLLSNSAEGAQSGYPFVATDPEGRKVPIVQAYAYTQYLGDLTVGFDENGEIVAWEGDTKRLTDDIPQDTKVIEVVNSYAEPLNEVRQKIVGYSEKPINGDRAFCRVVECEMGNLIADAMLERTKDQGITLAFQNGGGIRASIDEGDITMEEVLTVLPFQNTLATFQVTGKDVKAALENGVSQIEDVEGRFLQVAGLRYTFDPSLPTGERVTSVEVQESENWVPLDETKTYGAVTNDYVRGGGDGFSIFKENAINPYDFGPNLEDVVIEYLTQHPEYEPKLDGRITVLEPSKIDEAKEAVKDAVDVAAAKTEEVMDASKVKAEEAKEALKVAMDKTSEKTAEMMEVGKEKATEMMDATKEKATEAKAAIDNYVVKTGDTLSGISKKLLGDGERYPDFFKANKDKIDDQNIIYPGQELNVPQ